jgi:glutamine amidotransferase
LYFHLGPMPGEKAWDLDSAEGLAGFDRLVDRNIHANTGGPRQRRNPSFQAILKKKIFATQSLLVSSEPLSMNGLANWQLCPPNCMIIAHPTQPTKGRCSREFLLQQLNEERAAGAVGDDAAPSSPTKSTRQMTSSDSPVLEIEFKCLEDLCDTILSYKPKMENSASASNIPALASAPKPEIRRKNSLPDQMTVDDSTHFLTTPDSPPTSSPYPPSALYSPTPARAVRPGGMLGISGLSQQLARSSLRTPDSAFTEAEVGVRPNSTSRLSVDHHGTSPSDRKHAVRREHSITNMAGSSWHEGSRYLH